MKTRGFHLKKLLLCTVVFLLIMENQANTIAASKDTGVNAELITDKDSYDIKEDISLTLKITNDNLYDIDDVMLQWEIPKRVQLLEQSKLPEHVSLKSNESVVYKSE